MMDTPNPYTPPNSNLENKTDIQDITRYRKKLIPIWIKIFGWLFIVMGTAVPFVGIFSAVTGVEGNYSLYGLEETGSLFSPIPLLIVALFVVHAVCAFGLLFGKSWGVRACLILAYISVAICLFTTFSGDGSIRLEILLLIFYILKLRKLQPIWFGPLTDENSESTPIGTDGVN